MKQRSEWMEEARVWLSRCAHTPSREEIISDVLDVFGDLTSDEALTALEWAGCKTGREYGIMLACYIETIIEEDKHMKIDITPDDLSLLITSLIDWGTQANLRSFNADTPEDARDAAAAYRWSCELVSSLKEQRDCYLYRGGDPNE